MTADCSGVAHDTPEHLPTTGPLGLLGSPLSSRALSSVLAGSPATIARWRADLGVREPVRGLDGKTYPPPLTTEERDWAVSFVHYWRHVDGMTYRQIVEALHACYLPGSLGTVRRYLTDWRCESCAEDVTPTRDDDPRGTP